MTVCRGGAQRLICVLFPVSSTPSLGSTYINIAVNEFPCCSCFDYCSLKQCAQEWTEIELQVLVRSGTDTERKYAAAIAPVRGAEPPVCLSWVFACGPI